MPEVSTENATIGYEVHGAGPSLVLINGMGFGRWGFFKQIPTLSRRFATITFDAREGETPTASSKGSPPTWRASSSTWG
jgi:pimeloyl-ACP methyl ester carboxylesterase